MKTSISLMIVGFAIAFVSLSTHGFSILRVVGGLVFSVGAAMFCVKIQTNHARGQKAVHTKKESSERDRGHPSV